MFEPESPSPLVVLAKATERFPGFVLGFVMSTLISLMSDPLVASLAIGSVALGFATNVFVAIATFWLLHTILRTISGVATTIHTNGQQISGAIAYHANATAAH